MRDRAGVWFVAGLLACASAAAARADSAGYPIREIAISGDRELLAREGLLDAWLSGLVGRTCTPERIQAEAGRLRDQLRAKGYRLASVRTPPADYATGVAPVEVDAGRVGRIALTGPQGAPFEGRWFSERQIRHRLSGLAEGDPFQESVFYQHILGFNTHPDLVLDPSISLRKETEDGIVRRYADLQCAVTESRPLHGQVTVDNAGVDASGEWRAWGLVQYLNLTRRDDILSLFLGPASEGDGNSRAAAASYLRPHTAGRGGGTLLYAGYSDVEAQDVADLFTIQGEGWFAGLREDWRLAANPAREVVLRAGAGWRSQEETFSVDQDGNEQDGDTRDVAVIPLSLGLQVTPLRLDDLGGRTFLELEAVLGPGEWTGSEEDIEEFRPGAESTYLVGRLRLARLQPLGAAPRERVGEAWLLFARTELQAANGALLGAEQIGLGGMESVRGFEERAIMGDAGGEATLEFRSPLFGSRHRVQGVLFADAGHARSEGDDDMDAVTLAGAGAGVRLALGRHSQVRADLGVPVAGTDDVEEETGSEVDAARVHVAASLLF